jgi:hypothetical protein
MILELTSKYLAMIAFALLKMRLDLRNIPSVNFDRLPRLRGGLRCSWCITIRSLL